MTEDQSIQKHLNLLLALYELHRKEKTISGLRKKILKFFSPKS